MYIWRILSREADICDLHFAVRITLLVLAGCDPEFSTFTDLCICDTAFPPSLVLCSTQDPRTLIHAMKYGQ